MYSYLFYNLHILNCLFNYKFVGYVLPKFAQLTVTSYYASSSASHYGISLLTRHIEESYASRAQQEKLR